MLVKVCGLNSTENIASLPLALIDWLGFIFYEKSSRMVTFNPEEQFFEVTQNHKRVGVFVNAPLTTILSNVKQYGLHVIQLHGQEPIEHCEYLKHNGLQVVKVVSVNENTNFQPFEKYESLVDYFLFDTKSILHGGTGKKFNWNILKKYTLQTPFILSGGIGPDDSEKIKQLELAKCVGIDINSRFETAPGLKDAAQIQPFLKSIKDTRYVTD
jgi:phosphoribosylanthranilate isomerase